MGPTTQVRGWPEDFSSSLPARALPECTMDRSGSGPTPPAIAVTVTAKYTATSSRADQWPWQMVHPFMIQFRSPCSEMPGGSQEGSGPLNFWVTLSRSDWGNYLFI